MNGRSEGSDIDLAIYCPPDVLHMGGPLFGDAQSIKTALDDFLNARVIDDKMEIPKCTVCGFPDCNCKACNVINESKSTGFKTKSKLSHSCGLAHCDLKGAPPKKGYYDEEMSSLLLVAWQEKGIPSAPVFVKRGAGQSGFFWPEEIA